MNEENKRIEPIDLQTEESEQPLGNGDEPTAQSNGAKKRGAVYFFFDILEMFAWSFLVVMLIFTFTVRICRVDGKSMEDTLHQDQRLLIYSWNYTPRQDDIVVFHLTQPEADLEKTVVKRVIATEGQTVEINFDTCVITIDGVEYHDQYSVLKNPFTNQETGIYSLTAEHHYDYKTNTFSATVPEGHVFVMGDNRNNSRDSRDAEMGFIDTRCILGKAILSLTPFTTFS